jgi:hypothetical protein
MFFLFFYLQVFSSEKQNFLYNDIKIDQYNCPIICNNKYCSCNQVITLYNKFKQKSIFPHVKDILKQELELLNHKPTKGLCGGEYNEQNEYLINYINNFIKLLQIKNNESVENTLSYMCTLSRENKNFLKKIGDILLTFIEKTNKKNSIFNFKGLIKKNPITLTNKDTLDIINFTDFIYDKFQEINENKNQDLVKDSVSYRKYKLLIMHHLISEEFNNNEKKILIKNVIKIAKENEKNSYIVEKLENFVKGIW